MSATSIEWTDWSVNPIRARSPKPGRTGHYCEKISPGCRNCYSSRFQPRVGLPQFQEQRGHMPELFLDSKALTSVLRRKKPTKIFWCDMTDLFGDWVPFEWIAACFGAMAATPQHIHQVLTKRPDRALDFFNWVGVAGGIGPWLRANPKKVSDFFAASSRFATYRGRVHRTGDDAFAMVLNGASFVVDTVFNVHLGVSVESQKYADERIPRLLQCPAAVRWVSAEPLLGPVDLSAYLVDDLHRIGRAPRMELDWVVVGGESGPGARPFDLEWGRLVVAQCKAAGVPVFVKQLGACPKVPNGLQPPGTRAKMHVVGLRQTLALKLKSSKGGDPSEWPEDLRVREFPRGAGVAA